MFTDFSRPIAIAIRFAQQLRERREQYRAQRMLDSLPEHLRKDIGWPDRELEREVRVPRMSAKSAIWNAEAMLARTECPSVFGSSRDHHVRKAA
jgi:hypothetical protein